MHLQDALPYDLVIFDLDGTLTDSEPGITRSVQYALEQMNRPGYRTEDLGFFVGPPLLDSFVGDLGMSEAEGYEAIRHFQKRYEEKGWMENSVFTGIPAMLRSLKERGAKLAVATCKPLNFSERILDAFGLKDYIDRLAAPVREDESSDKARLVRACLEEEHSRAVMVGDRKFDMRGGRDTGIDALGVLYGSGSREELEASGATRIAGSVEELSRALLGGEGPSRGRFIDMEGSDGCGKSTQIALLAQKLREWGHEVVLTREPGGCPLSEKIRELLLSRENAGMTPLCEALLFAAARAQHVSEVVRPALERGAVVLTDRFLDSSLAYQAFGRELGEDWVRGINRRAVEGCEPDLTLFLSLDPSLAAARRAAQSEPDRIESGRQDFLRRVYEGFEALSGREAHARVDAAGPREEVAARVLGAVRKILS